MTDSLDRGIPRLAGVCLFAFGALMAATLHWGFVRSTELAARPDNLRRVAYDRRIRRGAILDRRGRILARTQFDAEGRPTRLYPFPAAAPVTGYQSWRYGAGGSQRATYGAGGAEAAYDLALRGDLGLSFGQLVAAQVFHRPQVGHDVVLTLDAELQTAAADELGDREGAVVVLEVPSGAVLALVSQPTFDPASLDADPAAADHPQRPFFNRATQGLYPPGSTWKTVTLAAALSAGLADPDVVVADGEAVEYFEGYPVRCNNNPEGVTAFTIAEAYGWSCNVTFARLAVALGVEPYRAAARDFGVGGAPPFPLPVTPSDLGMDGPTSLPELASAGFGQGDVMVTPLHMALIALAVAGDGRMPAPHLLADVPGVPYRAIADEQGTWRQPMSPTIAAVMRRIMAQSGRVGSARTASRAAGLMVGGKTGTAEAPSGPPHAWFIGFAPAEAPRVATAVLLPHGGEGAAVAAPIGGRVLARALAVLGGDE